MSPLSGRRHIEAHRDFGSPRVKDFARVAQLSAEEAFRLLQNRHDREHQSAWSRFETELAKRTVEIRGRHGEELRAAKSERDDLTRRIEASLRELAEVRERNQALEAELSKVARVGKREEMDFAEEARTWAGIWVSEKLPRNGDFILSYRAPSGDPVEPKLLIDNKDKSVIAESDIEKLVRDAKERSIRVAALVTREEGQLRQVDRESRWSRKQGVWLLRTTRQWFLRDLDLLKPIFERMRVQGFDLLEGSTVPPESVGDVLAKTTSSDWPLGLIVMAKYGFADHQMGDQQKVERNAVELSNTLSNLGIQVVWGPPSA
jgi:hypothetical protein